MILKLKIDVTKILKEKLFEGKKGTYLDATVLIKDTPDQYGNDGMIVQDVSYEERQAGEKGPILGNAKWAIGPEGKQEPPTNDPGQNYRDKAAKMTQPHHSTVDAGDGDDIPF